MTPGSDAPAADIARLLAEHPPELQAIEQALRRLIRSEALAAEERVDFGNKLIAFGWTMGMRDLLFALICHKSWVNVQLADGADLADPTGIVEGTGKKIRHVKVHSLDDVTRPALHALIQAQIAIRPPRA